MGDLVISFNDMVEQLDKQALLSKGFASGVSHEFKTPLSAIRGYAQLLGEETSPQKRAYYSEIIVQKTDALTNLVNKMLELFRLENQGTEIPKTVFSLDEQIRKTIIFLEPVWYAKRIEMIPVLTPVSYCGAKEFIGQIWQNLIENAVKFTPSGGKITVSLEKRGDDVLVRVADSGIGMDEETRAHMFDEFYQGSPAQSFDGVGLGLALTKRILALAHGSIRVESAPNRGTTIEVLLPAKDA